MAHDHILRALGRRHETSDFAAEVVVTTGESALVPDFQQGLSKHTILGSIHCHLVILTSRNQDNTALYVHLFSTWGFLANAALHPSPLLPTLPLPVTDHALAPAIAPCP